MVLPLPRTACSIGAVLVMLLSGCAAWKDSPSTPLPSDVPSSWSSDVTIAGLPITSDLLDLIDEHRAEELVREGLENNPNLRATALRLRAAGYLLSGPRSRLLPLLSAEFDKGRGKQETGLGQPFTTDSHRLSLGVRWEIDLWGRLADEYAAAQYAVLARDYEYLRVRDALAARIVQTWVQQAAARRSLSIERERVAVLERIESILLERYQGGIGSLDELSTAKSRTQIARTDLSTQRAIWQQTIRRLELLLGRYPRGELLAGDCLPEIAPPSPGVPADILLNRPDIKAALAQAESARQTARAAEKAMLPDIRLSGQLFREAARLDNLSGATTYWNVLGSLFQPLFEAGRIRNEARARRTETEAALLELHVVILQALKEVEDAFDAERELALQAEALGLAARESEKSSRYYEGRYRQGLDTVQNLLIAREQEMSVKVRLNQVQAERLINRIDMALALGVGLADRPTSSEGVAKL